MGNENKFWIWIWRFHRIINNRKTKIIGIIYIETDYILFKCLNSYHVLNIFELIEKKIVFFYFQWLWWKVFQLSLKLF